VYNGIIQTCLISLFPLLTKWPDKKLPVLAQSHRYLDLLEL